MLFTIWSVLVLCFLNYSHCAKSYVNYTLYRGVPLNEEQLLFLKSLDVTFNVDYWRQPGQLHMPSEFLVSPKKKAAFIKEARKCELPLTSFEDNVQKLFDQQAVKSYIRRNLDSFDWRSYFRLKDIYTWLKDLTKLYPNYLRLEKIGMSYEHRNIYVLRLAKTKKPRSTVIMEGGIHAREWIAPAVVTYIIHQLVNVTMESDPVLYNISHTYEFFFVPVLNPDGYEYSHTEDRMWRKNRRGNYGVDLNRNFGIAFGAVGVSDNKRDEIYNGPSAFSEPESSSMGNFIVAHSEHLEYYLAFHSYGQFMILPYAHSTRHWDNYNKVRQIGKEMAIVIGRRYGTKYQVGTAYDTVGYLTSGVSGCWVKLSFRVPYVITFELRDDGKHGFALPPSEILPTCKETMDGIIALLTPKTERAVKMNYEEMFPISGMKERSILDLTVFFFNVLLFIIARFD